MDDWQVGDLALCVGPATGIGFGAALECKPEIGSINTVSAVRSARAPYVMLSFESDPNTRPCQWVSKTFRKITLGHEPVGIEEPRRAPVMAPVNV